MAWAVTPVRESKDSRGALGGAGFTLADQDGRPCVTFGYPTLEEARQAHQHLKAALRNAREIVRH